MEKRATVIRPEKVARVDALAEQLSQSSMAVLTDYRGLTVAQVTALRRQLRPANVEFHVTKNTLTRLAARQSGREAVIPALTGPTAIALSYGDPVELARALNDAIRTQRLALTVKNVLLGDRLLPGSDMARLADLPSRDTLIAQVVGTIQAPISNLVGVLAATMQGIVGVLDARRRQLEEGGAA
jgi:large subunit ribosomal protein L10